MLNSVVSLLGCAVVLFFASRIVYRQVVVISGQLRVPAFLVSLVLVAFSTSIPELFVGITSAMQGTPSFSLGDILGTNIVNLTFIAGLIILLGRKDIELTNNMSTTLMLSTFGVASVPVFMLIDGTLSRIDGSILLLLYAGYLYLVLKSHKRSPEQTTASKTGLFKPLLTFAFGVALLIVAAEIMIGSATSISEHLQIAPFIIGVFLLAISTSMPELVFGLRATLQGQPELSLGDLLGSCAVNAAGILGVVALIHPIVPAGLTAALFSGFYGVFVFFVFFLLAGKGRIRSSSGAILLIMYLVFVAFHFVLAA